MVRGTDLVLVDTSAWIHSFRHGESPMASRIRRLLDEDRVALCGPVLLEIRRGLRPTDSKLVLDLFQALVWLPFEEMDWGDAGLLDVSLRRKGTTLPSLDVLIAHVCLKNRVSILTLDGHFRLVPNLQVVDDAAQE
jgi:predicted nucleic acid-binding protein